MIIETSRSSIYSAAVLMGTLDNCIPVSGKLVCTKGPLTMAVVMKVAYDLVVDGTNPLRMDAVANPARSAIVMADSGVQTASNGFDLTYEADTALAKERADIVVLGFVSSSEEGAIVVNDQQRDKQWLTRRPPSLPDKSDADMKRNLFGFEPRAGAPRKDEINNLRIFSSIHRRRPGFFNDAGSGYQLPSGGVVKIYQRIDTTAGDPECSLQLPNLEQGIRLRAYCGHGPDQAPYWRKVNLGLMRADTLIVEPSKRQAVILWRCHWNADLEPMDRYRKVQIRAGGF